MKSLKKTPSEVLKVRTSYTDELTSGVTLSSATVSAASCADGADVSGSLLASTTGTVSGSDVFFTVQAGEDGGLYVVRLVATLSDSSVLEDVWEVEVTKDL